MIKIFKWYIVSDLDLFIEKDTACRTLNRRIKYLEKENENLYFENDRLRNKQVQVTNIIEPKDITLKNYISKDKIREKIKEITSYTYTSVEERECQIYARQVLKDLLGEK